jgi:hypothetical protein
MRSRSPRVLSAFATVLLLLAVSTLLPGGFHIYLPYRVTPMLQTPRPGRPRPSAPTQSHLQRSNDPVVDRVALWIPHTRDCRGSFNIYSKRVAPNSSQSSSASPIKPALLVREAFADRRHVSIKEFVSKRHPSRPFQRVAILLTALPHGMTTLVEGPSQPTRMVNLTGQREPLDPKYFKTSILYENGTAVRNLTAHLDFFVDEVACARACKHIVTCRVKEWQLIATIDTKNRKATHGDLNTLIERATAANALLEINLPMKMRGGDVENLKLRLSLSCIAGLSSRTAMPKLRHLPPRSDTCDKARGAVALSGGPLFGAHLHDPVAWRGIAHYAARALFGNMWHETVAVGVHPRHTLADMHYVCTNNYTNLAEQSRCIVEHHDRNTRLLKNIAMEIEKEFTMLGIPRADWSRLILFPTCRLGSDFLGKEKGMPCEESHHGGQKILGHSGYAMFGPHHAWVTNFDMDEFIIDEGFIHPPSSTRVKTESLEYLSASVIQSAAQRFDSIQRKHGKSSLRMPWFDFRLEPKSIGNLTKDVMHGKLIQMQGFGDQIGAAFNKTNCYMGSIADRSFNWGGGKIAQHCSDGFGFMVHDAYNLERDLKTLDLSSPNCAARTQRSHPPPFPIFTYHARGLEPRFGKCTYYSE